METQTELGWIYKVKEDWAIAEKYYLTGLDLATLLAQLDPIQYFQELDPIQEALANFYLEVKDTVRAEKYMCMSVESRIQMFIDELGDSLATSPKRIIRKISRAWKEFYLEDLRNLDKAEKFFLKQINRFTQLSEQKPRKYGEILLEFIGVLSSLFEKYTFDEYHLEERGYDSKDPKYLAKQEEYELKEIEALKFLIQLDFDYWGNWLAKANFSADYYKNSKSWVQIYLLQVETCLKLGYNEGAMEALYKLEYLYLFELKDYIKAEDIYLKELENLQQLYEQDSSSDNCANLAKTQYRLGELYYFYLKDYAKAEDFYLKALTNRTQLYEKDSSSDNCNDLAWTQFRLGELYYLHLKDYAKAEEYYLKALENYTYLFTQDPDAHHADLAMTLNNLGSLYDDLHDYAKAEEYFLKVFENYTKLFSQNPERYRYGMAIAQHNLGYIYSKAQNYSKAEEYLRMALENKTVLYNQDSDAYRANLANSYNQLAYLYAHQNNFTKAIETIDQAIELMPEEVNLYDSKGEILLMKGDEQEAVKMWQKVLELDPDFLQKYEGGTDFYKQLKEKGLIED